MVAYDMMLISMIGLVYCMDYLERNIDWLEEKLKPLIEGEYRIAICINKIICLAAISQIMYLKSAKHSYGKTCEYLISIELLFTYGFMILID
jgi:hypothetical protein